MDCPPGIDDDLRRLRAVAGRMDDLFRLGLPDAPSWCFVGGRFCVPAGERTLAFSAGAADPDPDAAFRRCAGEAAETMAQSLGGRPDGVSRLLDAPVGLDREEIDVLAGLAGDGVEAGWTAARRLSDGAAASVPAALCFRDMGAEGTATSLGCACGTSLDEATQSALLELIERDAVALWWHGGAPAHRLAGFDGAVAAMRGDASLRRTWFLDLATDLEIPVVAAISSDGEGRDVAAGFAARPTAEAAAGAALRELAQMELGNRLVRLKLERGGEAALGEGERRQWRRMTRLDAADPALTGVDAPARRPAQTLPEPGECLTAAGIDAFVVDITMPEIGIPTVKVVAPRLQGDPRGHATQRLLDARKNHGHHASEVSTPGILW